MRITFSGATGFIGSKLARHWLAEGHELHVLARKRGEMPPAVRFWEWPDPAQSDPPLESLDGSDAVINLAGEPVAQRWNESVKHRILASRVDGTAHLVKAISELRHKPQVLVNASAVGYYGSRGDEILTESSPPGAGFLSEVCCQWEQRALEATNFGLRVVCLRIGIVLGKGGGALAQMLTPFRLGIGGKLGSGRQWMPWIHIDDIVGLCDFALRTESAHGPLNACSPNPATNAAFSKELGHALHRPALMPVPKVALKLLFGEMGEVVLGSQRALPKLALASGYQFRYPDLAGALSQLLN